MSKLKEILHIYRRVSTRVQEEKYSLEDQLKGARPDRGREEDQRHRREACGRGQAGRRRQGCERKGTE